MYLQLLPVIVEGKKKIIIYEMANTSQYQDLIFSYSMSDVVPYRVKCIVPLGTKYL